jgi:hypothetical protein
MLPTAVLVTILDVLLDRLVEHAHQPTVIYTGWSVRRMWQPLFGSYVLT